MSGGRFDYIQHRFSFIIDEIQSIIDNNGKELTKEEKRDINLDPEYFEKYPSEAFHPQYSYVSILHFKDALRSLKLSEVYLNRIDYLLSCDDSEESFLERLNEELINIK